MGRSEFIFIQNFLLLEIGTQHLIIGERNRKYFSFKAKPEEYVCENFKKASKCLD